MIASSPTDAAACLRYHRPERLTALAEAGLASSTAAMTVSSCTSAHAHGFPEGVEVMRRIFLMSPSRDQLGGPRDPDRRGASTCRTCRPTPTVRTDDQPDALATAARSRCADDA